MRPRTGMDGAYWKGEPSRGLRLPHQDTHTMNGSAARYVMMILLIAVMLAPVLAGAQGTAETQKGLPPDPNAASPEYARPKSAPERPALEPPPGKPALD